MDRKCTKCGTNLNETNSIIDSRGRVRSWCKKCTSDYSKQYKRDHRASLNRYQRLWNLGYNADEQKVLLDEITPCK